MTGTHGSAGRHRAGINVSVLLAAGSALAYGGSRWLLTNREREEPHSALRPSILPSVWAATVNHQPSVRKLLHCIKSVDSCQISEFYKLFLVGLLLPNCV